MGCHALILAVLFFMPAGLGAQAPLAPTIWEVDESADDSGSLHLWSFADYNNATATGTDYGRLKYLHPTLGVRDISDGGDMESMAVNTYTGQAYFMSADKVQNGPSNSQAIYTYNLNQAAANAGNIVLTLIGHIIKPSGVKAESLAFDPTTHRFYFGDPKDSGSQSSTVTDDLYYINLSSLNANPMVATPAVRVGAMQGAIGGTLYQNRYTDGLEITSTGQMFAVDGTDDHLYEISKSTGAIIGTPDLNLAGGLNGNVDIETLAWDAINGKLIATDNSGHRFVHVTLGSNGANVECSKFKPGTPGLNPNVDFEASAMYSVQPASQVAIGNLVFRDNNGNGRFDAGDAGVSSVTLKLFRAGQAPTEIPVATTTTNGSGIYVFDHLTAGQFFVHIPASEFGNGKPLMGLASAPPVGADNASDDDADENGSNPVAPSTTGVSSNVFDLQPNTEPTGEAGQPGYGGALDDNNVNLTADFGFAPSQLFAVDSSTRNLFAIDPATGVLTTIADSTKIPWVPAAVAYDPSGGGKVFYVRYDNSPARQWQIGRYDLATASNTVLAGSLADAGFSYALSARPDNLGFFAGSLFFVAPGTDDLVRVNIAGNAITDLIKAADITADAQSFTDPGDLTVTGAGRLLFTHQGGLAEFDLTALDPSSYVLRLTDPAGPLKALSFDTMGNLYAVKWSPDNQVQKINTAAWTLAFQSNVTPATAIADFAWAEPTVTLPSAAADFGDFSGFATASSTVAAAIKIGALTDTEMIATTDASATGDDNTGSDDEDGLSVPAAMAQASASSMAANVTNTSGATVYLSAWIDFNRNGSLADAGEQIAANIGIASGTVGATQTINFSVPAAAAPGTAGVRVRLTSTINPGPTGAAGSGEVEDTITTITVPPLSLGNLVWFDADNDGFKDAGESGLGGAIVRLFTPGADNAIGGTGADADVQVSADQTSGASGLFTFAGLAPGNYFVKVTPPVGYEASGGVSDPADNGEDDDNNALVNATDPGAFFSPIINLAPGAESITDGDASANTDLTVDFGLRPPDPPPQPVSLGNFVWNDANQNGFQDAGEAGINGVVLELWQPGADNVANTADDVNTGSTVTTSGGGAYAFTGLTAGLYFVKIPSPPVAYPIASGSPGTDDGVDTDNNGSQAAPGDPVFGPVVLLTPGAEPPGGNGNANNTIDFGFKSQPPILGFGNLVFIDANSNGHADAGEGVDGVTVELYDSGSEPGVDIPLATTVTSGGGHYLLSAPAAGGYRAHIPAAMFAQGAPLYQRVSIQEGLSGDDDVGEDGLNDSDPPTDGVTSGLVSIALGQAPTDDNGETGLGSASDNDADAAVDLTIDFGFQNPVGVGNVVFIDANDNGHYDSGEGVDGINVDLYAAGQSPGSSTPLFSQTTANGGRFFFNYLPAGDYFLHVPAVEFEAGHPLAGMLSVTGESGNGDDDAGEDGLDEAAPQVNGVRTRTFHLGNDAAPTDAASESGVFNTADNADDDNYDLTIDLGFVTPDPDSVGVGNLVFVDANASGGYEDGEGVDGVVVQLFAAGADPQSAPPVASTVTSNEGLYLFGNLPAGNYFIHIPAAELQADRPLAGAVSLPGNGADDGYDDFQDENGVDAPNPPATGISSPVFALQPGTEPIDTVSEVGRGFYLDAVDANTDLTIDFGFFVPVAIGNLVFRDANGNGHADAGEGAGGVRIEIFFEGDDPLFDPPLATAITSAEGRYLFGNLLPGAYFINIPASEFQAGKPLYQALSVTGVQAGDDDAGEDGIDEAVPIIYGVRSAAVTVAPGSAPTGSAEPGQGGTDDDAEDAAVDLTIDFGFTQPALHPIRGQVRNDLDRDGDFADADAPLRNVGIALYRDVDDDGLLGVSDELILTTTTAADGSYVFTNLPDGNYLVVETDPPGAASTADADGGNDNTILVALAGADSNGNDFLDALDPQGYIYSPIDGSLVTGGTVTVSGPGQITILMDGSTGAYAWTSGGSPGLYTVSYNPPANLQLDPSRPSEFVALDPTGVPSPFVIGSALNDAGRIDDISAAANPWFVVFDLAPGDPEVIRNNIPVIPMAPNSWSEWQYFHPLGGQNGPALNPDGDEHDNLQEFAFQFAPDSGVGALWPCEVRADSATGRIDALVRRVTGIEGVNYVLEGIAALAQSPAGWFDITTIPPVVTPNGDGTETAAYQDLEQVAALAGGQGFVRVRLELDSDGDSAVDAISQTRAVGWVRRTLPAAVQTFSMPFLNVPVFGGTVDAINGNLLDVSTSAGGQSVAAALTGGGQFFIEVTAGENHGHRFEIDEAASTAATLAVDVSNPLNTKPAVPADLAGDSTVVRVHWALGGLCSPSRFNSTNNQTTADRALFFDRSTGSYQIYWLFRNNDSPKWVLSGDAQLADAGGRLITPLEGMFLNPKTNPVPMTFVGAVRQNGVACPLIAGNSFVGGGWPLDESPNSRLMTVADGFTGSRLASTADQLRIWAGDVTPSQASFSSHYLLSTATLQRWVNQADATLADESASFLFTPLRAVFVKSVAGKSDWIMPLPWTP